MYDLVYDKLRIKEDPYAQDMIEFELDNISYEPIDGENQIRITYKVILTFDQEKYLNNANTPKKEKYWDYIRLAMMSSANTCIIQAQDLLGLGAEARMNFPSTLGTNWKT